VLELLEDSDWLFLLSGAGNLPMISICGEIISKYSDALAACGGSPQHVLQPSDVTLNPDFFLLGMASLHNLPAIMFALLGLGVMVALWSTADGLILVIANTLSNDFYRNVFRPRSPMSVRLFMTRFMLMLTICLSAAIAILLDLDKVLLLETGIALSAAALFPAILMSIFAKNQKPWHYVIIMLTGLGVSGSLIIPAFYPPVIAVLAWGDFAPFTAGLYGLLSAIGISIAINIIQRIPVKLKGRENAPVAN